MAAAAGIGVKVDAGRVPVLPETAAICGYLRIDPLGLIGSGALLVAAPDAVRTAGAIAGAGVQVKEIGRFVPRDRLIVRDNREMPLTPPASDELWRVLARGS
jgi:hydrogenase maturation factor